MEKYLKTFAVNLGLLLSGLLTVFSGLLIQVNYHMGNRGNISSSDLTLGINYYGWSDIHKIAIVALSALMVFHVARHWKWYKIVVTKKLVSKNKQVITLTILFVLVAITGFVPWFIDLWNGNEMQRKAFIEIHDKLALFLSVYFALHIIKRIKWFFVAFEKLTNKQNT